MIVPLSTFSSNERIPKYFPKQVWLRTWLLIVTLVLIFIGGWETYWRLQGYVPSIEDDWGLWAANRRLVNHQEPRTIALIGASRVQLGLHPDVFFHATGIRTLMLAIDGNSPLPVLQNLADDPKFSSLVICGLTPQWLAESTVTGRRVEKWIRKSRKQKWSSRLETHLSVAVRQSFVFRFPGLSPGRIWSHLVQGKPLKKLYAPMRVDRYRPADYSKTDIQLLKNAREKRMQQLALNTVPLTAEAYGERVMQIGQWVEKIEERGGHVVFVRMPSTGAIREIEEVAWPRSRFWDPFADQMKGLTLHFEDYQILNELICPDGSHLDSHDAIIFTKELVNIFHLTYKEKS
jgi:hypothetical protein